MVVYDPSAFPDELPIHDGWGDDIFNDGSGDTLPEWMGRVGAAIRDLNSRIAPASDYDLTTSFGLTTSDSPTALATGINVAVQWISANAPGATLIIPVGTWIINAPIFLRPSITIRGRSKTRTILFMADDAQRSVIEVAPGVGELHDVNIENMTIDGNRYNQNFVGYSTPDGNCISLTADAYRHDIKIVDVITIRPDNYGVALSGTGYMHDVWLIRVHVIDAGSDGIDSRGEWPYNRRMYAEGCTLEGYAFRRGFSAAGLDLRGQWQVTNPTIVIKPRPDSAGVRFRPEGEWDGTGNGYGSMFSTVTGANVTAGGGSINQAIIKGSGITDIHNQVTGTIIRRPVPRVVSFIDYTNVGGAISATYAMPAPPYRPCQPWRTQMLIVASRTTVSGQFPNVPTFDGAGLTWVSGDPLRPAIEGSRTTTQARLSVLHALPTFHISNAVDWSLDPTDPQPHPPTVPVTSGAPTAANGTITFSVPQSYCIAFWVEWDDASLLHGYMAQDPAPGSFVNYGSHGADSMVQSVGANPSVAPYQVTLSTFDLLETGVDRWGNAATNVGFGAVFNATANGAVFTPKTGYRSIGQKYSSTAPTIVNGVVTARGTARSLSLFFRIDDLDPVPGGTFDIAGATTAMLGMEIRTGR